MFQNPCAKIDRSLLFSPRFISLRKLDTIMIWSRKQLVGPRIAQDVINAKTSELKMAKKILAELLDIRTHAVDEMIGRGWK
jgi:hypothetical protein